MVVSRGESVEIGGGFRVPEVMEQSGAQLVDVGTTNRTRLARLSQGARPQGRRRRDGAEGASQQLPRRGVRRVDDRRRARDARAPVVADIGSGLIDANCPWLAGPPPAWLHGEPAARQTMQDGAALVTFSGDKLFGGPQAGIIVGRADLVATVRAASTGHAPCAPGHTCWRRCSAPRSRTSAGPQRPTSRSGRWSTAPIDDLRVRAEAIADRAERSVRCSRPRRCPGAGSAPGATMPSIGVALDGDHLAGAAIVRRRRSSRASATARRASTCATIDPETTPIAALARIVARSVRPTRVAGRSHRHCRSRGPRQVVAGAGADRHRPRSLRGGGSDAA